MNWRAIILTWLFGCSAFIHGQSSFQRVYLSGAADRMNMHELPSGNVFVGMGWGPGISLLTPDGNIIYTDHYWSDSILVQASIRPAGVNDYYFVTGYRRDSCTVNGTLTIPYTYALIGRMDSLGTISSVNCYQPNTDRCWSRAADLEVAENGDVIIWGSGGRGIQWSFYALRTDPFGEVVWGKHYGAHGSFQFIKELPSGDLLAGMNMDSAGAVVARMNAQGQLLWCKSYFRPKGMIHDVIILTDTNFVLTGYTDSLSSANPFEPIPSGYHPQLFMLNVDGNGDVMWCKGYDSAPHLWWALSSSRIVSSQDGGFVVLATLSYPGFSAAYRPYLMKTDSNGDTLWTNSAGEDGYSYETIELLATDDGGYMFNGVVLGSLPQGWLGSPYIFKADALGQLPCSERIHAVEVNSLFPSDSSFILSAVDGGTRFSISLRDTSFNPIAQYDACDFTNALLPSARRSPQHSVSPNPSQGLVSLSFSDPLRADSFYSVFDGTGRLLFQRPLPSGATSEDIDLSRFGRGTYLLRLSGPEGVYHERVVVSP